MFHGLYSCSFGVFALFCSDMLMDKHHIYAQPINYPTVPRGGERLRFTPTPLHDDASFDRLIRGLLDVWQTVGIPMRDKMDALKVHQQPLVMSASVSSPSKTSSSPPPSPASATPHVHPHQLHATAHPMPHVERSAQKATLAL
jgi:hypothetical protein